jgi:hypothetical protein
MSMASMESLDVLGIHNENSSDSMFIQEKNRKTLPLDPASLADKDLFEDDHTSQWPARRCRALAAPAGRWYHVW